MSTHESGDMSDLSGVMSTHYSVGGTDLLVLRVSYFPSHQALSLYEKTNLPAR